MTVYNNKSKGMNFWIRPNGVNTLKGVEDDEFNKPVLPATLIQEMLSDYPDARKGFLELLPTMLPEEQERLQAIVDDCPNVMKDKPNHQQLEDNFQSKLNKPVIRFPR